MGKTGKTKKVNMFGGKACSSILSDDSDLESFGNYCPFIDTCKLFDLNSTKYRIPVRAMYEDGFCCNYKPERK